ncbi:PREDICTED: protein dead ringer-like isoform X2 [Polistes canadensis]|uniref:protein dead ringer-like isoform X2 n=1 Tax=Polistes canadensis TaxID=91411 RepID=UPI0007190602|nr:PREDICTED: protein dead ringer-like isoform X2 [Polistes canadensis]
MEMSDDYQDMVNPGGGMANLQPMGEHHQQTPESSPSNQEEELSDPDLQDQESGEELPPRPRVAVHPSVLPSNTSGTPLSNLSNLMNSHNPQFLAKLRMEAEADILTTKNSLEVLQAAMNNGVLNLQGFPLPMLPLPNMGIGGMIPQTPSVTTTLPMSVGAEGCSGTATTTQVLNVPMGIGHLDTTSSPSRSSESPRCRSRNGPDSATNYSLNVSSSSNGVNNNSHHHHSHNSSTSNNSNNNNNNNNNSQNNNNHPQNGQQPNNWNFEDQFKQLYELSDDPGRREFLDDLFSFMQGRGSPINRLPIMAKSVLDLYELFNLVIARGGLVDVINKKLWQEIIKGLQLPSSITSAAFTLRTQYMKYLYEYECARKNLSTPAELKLAIDGNRREGRRNTYVQFPTGSGNDGQRNQSTPLSMRSRMSPNAMQLHPQISPLSLVTAAAVTSAQSMVNGNSVHPSLVQHSQISQLPQGSLNHTQNISLTSVNASEFEARMAEYFRMYHREKFVATGSSPPIISQPGSSTPTTTTIPIPSNIQNYETLRNIQAVFGNNNTIYPAALAHHASLSPQASQSSLQPVPSPEPQREALDLGVRSSSVCSSPSVACGRSPLSSTSISRKRDSDSVTSGKKRRLSEVDESMETVQPSTSSTSKNIKISTETNNDDGSLNVSLTIEDATYRGVLFFDSGSRSKSDSSSSNSPPTTNDK